MFGARGTRYLFFDDARVTRAVDEQTLKNLSKAGAFLRRRARSSIRNRKRASKPGQAPSNRTGRLKDGIQFSFDTQTHSLITGPVILNQLSFDRDGNPVRGTIPRVLEEGGEIYILEVQFPNGKWYRKDNRRKRSDSWYRALPTRYRQVRIEARPYMLPAFEKEKVKSAKLWANCLQ